MKTQTVFGVLLCALLAVGMCGCEETIETLGGGGGDAMEEGSGEQVKMAIVVDRDLSDVAKILFKISCWDGIEFDLIHEGYVDVFPETIPEWLVPTGWSGPGMLGDGHLFADLFWLLPAGLCRLEASPRAADNSLLDDFCGYYDEEFEVLPDVPNEVIILLQCDFNRESLDFLVGLNAGPLVQNLTYQKFPWECLPITIQADVVDFDNDEIYYEWTVVHWPDAAIPYEWDLEPTDKPVVDFTPKTPGDYHLRLRVWDGFGGEATVDFLVHVRDADLIDDCERVCCKWQWEGEPPMNAGLVGDYFNYHDYYIGFVAAAACQEVLEGEILGDERCEYVCCEMDGEAHEVPLEKCLEETEAHDFLPGTSHRLEMCEEVCCFNPDECSFDYKQKLFCDADYQVSDCHCKMWSGEEQCPHHFCHLWPMPWEYPCGHPWIWDEGCPFHACHTGCKHSCHPWSQYCDGHGADWRCETDDDCGLVADYCDGCNCLALPAGHSAPYCHGDEVVCLVDPCSNYESAICEDGQCVAVPLS